MVEVLGVCNKFAVKAFEIYIILRLLRSLFKNELINKRGLAVAVLINAVSTFLVDYYVPYVWINLAMSILSIFVLTCCYRTTIWKKIIITTTINILLALAETVIAVIIGRDDFGVLAKAENEQSIALFLSRIVFWIIIISMQSFILRDNAVKFSGKIVILEIIVFATMICELLLLCTGTQKSILIESAILFGSEVTVYLMIYLQDCLVELFHSREQASLIEKEKEYYQREAVIILQKQELERQFRHDWKNRVQILRQLAEEENAQQLKKYVKEIEEKNEEHQIYSNTGNLIIDSIINSKLQEAISRNIAVTSSIMLPAGFEINTDDMVVILGNLLDNSIEACERLEASRSIDILLNYEEGCLILCIRNSFDQIINISGEEYVTRKENKDLHGIGLKSVNNTINKYNGVMEITTDDGLFAVNIMLYV